MQHQNINKIEIICWIISVICIVISGILLFNDVSSYLIWLFLDAEIFINALSDFLTKNDFKKINIFFMVSSSVLFVSNLILLF